MSTNGTYSGFGRLVPLYLAVIFILPLSVAAQEAVSFLKVAHKEATPSVLSGTRTSITPFELNSNLVLFFASVDGRTGRYAMDTGAPTLLINNRGATTGKLTMTGHGLGGEVRLTNRKVDSVRFGDYQVGAHWALALDLTELENSIGTRLDGFIGRDLIGNRELLLDYPGRRLAVRPSVRNPHYQGLAPRQRLKFTYYGHLPVVTLNINGRKLRFALDSGSSVSILDEDYAHFAMATGRHMAILGLDATATRQEVVRLTGLQEWGESPVDCNFIVSSLDHVQEVNQPALAGVLGSDFLSRYVVGVDYRRRRINLY